MTVRIRRVRDDEIEELVRRSLLAWAPVFASFERVLGPAIFARLYPDWRSGQESVVREMCGQSENRVTWVAEVDGTIAGFVVIELNGETGVGEIQLLAVHPDHQNRGIGTELNSFALREMKSAGMRLAVVGTGGDPGHAPARRSYEKAGFTALPLVRYYNEEPGAIRSSHSTLLKNRLSSSTLAGSLAALRRYPDRLTMNCEKIAMSSTMFQDLFNHLALIDRAVVRSYLVYCQDSRPARIDGVPDGAKSVILRFVAPGFEVAFDVHAVIHDDLTIDQSDQRSGMLDPKSIVLQRAIHIRPQKPRKLHLV